MPIVWEQFSDSAVAEYEKAQEIYERALIKYEQDYERWRSEHDANRLTGSDAPVQGSSKKRSRAAPVPPKIPHLRMQESEAVNFLCLSTALKIFFASTVDTAKLTRAQELLCDYLLGFREVFTSDPA